MQAKWQQKMWRFALLSFGATTLYGSACNARNVQAVIAGVDAATGQLIIDQRRDQQSSFEDFLDQLDRVF